MHLVIGPGQRPKLEGMGPGQTGSVGAEIGTRLTALRPRMAETQAPKVEKTEKTELVRAVGRKERRIGADRGQEDTVVEKP